MAISVTPDRIVFSTEKNEPATQGLFIKNLGSESTQIQISLSDEKWDSEVSINPQNVILAPQAESEIVIGLKSNKSFQTELEILSIPGANAELQVASGIKIPLNVSVPNSATQYNVLVPLVIAISAVFVFYFWRRKSLI